MFLTALTAASFALAAYQETEIARADVPWLELPAYQFLIQGGEDVLLGAYEKQEREFSRAEESIVAEVYRYTGNEPASWSIARRMKAEIEDQPRRSPRDEFLLHWATFRSVDERAMTVEIAKSVADGLHGCKARGESGFTIWVEGCAASAYVFQHAMQTQGEFPEDYIERTLSLANSAEGRKEGEVFPLFVQGDLLKSVGHFDGGVPLLQRALDANPKHALTRASVGAFANGRALAFHEKADLEWLEVIWREGMEHNPGIASFGVNWASAMSTLGRNTEALSVLGSMVVENGGGEDRTNRSRLLASYGIALWNANRLEDAEAEFRKAIAEWPGNIDCRHSLAAVMLERGKPAAALAFALESLELEPGNVQLLIDQARALAKTGEAAGSKALFDRIRRENPNCADAYYYDLKQRATTASRSRANRQLVEEYARAVPGDSRLGEIAQLFGMR